MRTRYALLPVFLSVLLTSCHPGTKVEVVNNTGQNLTVVSMDTELKETAYSVGSNQTVHIKVPSKLRVERDGEIWNYDLPPTQLPDKYRKRIRGNWYLEKVQIEKDGTINVLLPDSDGPVTNPPAQPAGYPLQPKKSSVGGFSQAVK